MSAAVDVEVEIDRNEIRRALARLEGVSGRVSVMYLQEQGVTPTYASYATTPAELEQAERDIVKADSVDEPLGVYVRGTTIRDGVSGRGVSDDTVVWIDYKADLDLGKPGGPATWPDLFAAYDRANLPTPTDWQHSGGGFYPRWALAEPVEHGPEAEALAADIEAELRRAWKAAGYTSGVDSCRDAARVWRLAGSVHRKNRAAPITSTIGKVSGEVYTFAELRARVPAREQSKAWDGQRTDPRIASADAFERTYLASQETCKARGRDDFRHTFFVAARNAHRMVAIGLRTQDEIRDELLELVHTFWPAAGFNGDDRQHIHDALNNGLDRGDNAGALASPWELTNVRQLPERRLYNAGEYGGGEYDEPGSNVDRVVLDAEVVTDAEEIERRAFERMVQDRLRWHEADEEARRRKALKAAAERPSLVDGLLDVTDLDSIEPPRMLMGELIPHASVGLLNGRTGTYKSFLAVSLGCSLAVGKPWQGREEFAVAEPVRVLYVAAEGAAGVAQRVMAWQRAHEKIPSGQFVVYPKPIKLNDQIAVEELGQVIADREIGMVIVDTLHRSTAGMEEQSNTEFGLVYEAVAGLRDAHGVTTLLVDHTGHRGGVIGRGASSKIDDADFALGVEREGEVPRPECQRTLKVVKLKDMPTEGEWPIRLQAVEGATAAVLEIGEATAAEDVSPFDLEEDWHSRAAAEVPERVALAIAAAAAPSKGKGKKAAIDIYRLLRFVGGERGMTLGELQKNLGEGPRTHHRSSVHAAHGLLTSAGIVCGGSTRDRVLIAPEYVS